MEKDPKSKNKEVISNKESNKGAFNEILVGGIIGIIGGFILQSNMTIKKENNLVPKGEITNLTESYSWIYQYEPKNNNNIFITPTKECPQINASELGRIDQNLYQPKPATKLGPTNNKSNMAKPEQMDMHKIQEIAKKLNLTVIDKDPYTNRINKAKSVDESLNILNEFSTHYDLKIEILENKDASDKGIELKTIKKNEIDEIKFNKGAENIINSFFSIPTEVVKASGIRKVKIVNSLKEDYNAGQYQFASLGAAIYLPINRIEEDGLREIVEHEIYHGIDEQECGYKDMFDDEQFNNLNPKDFTYGGENKQAEGTMVMPSYEYHAQSNIIEDKAALMQGRLGASNNKLYTDMPIVLQLKERLLLARLERIVPEITVYLRDVNP